MAPLNNVPSPEALFTKTTKLDFIEIDRNSAIGNKCLEIANKLALVLQDTYNNYDVRHQLYMQLYDTYFAGSCLHNMLKWGTNTTFGDYDIFFKKAEDAVEFTKLMSRNTKDLLKLGCVITSNTITFPTRISIVFNPLYAGPPETVVSRFDFDHTLAYIDINENEDTGYVIKATKEMLAASASNVISYRHNTKGYPTSSMIRLVKFAQRGMIVLPSTIREILYDIVVVGDRYHPVNLDKENADSYTELFIDRGNLNVT